MGLIEVLFGLIIITIASIATLTYFSHGRAAIGREGNRRIALELARQRMEDLMEGDLAQIAGANNDAAPYWLTCTGSPCAWTRSLVGVTQPVPVGNLPAQPMETTVQRLSDPAADADPATLETVVLGVKVWFTANLGVDDDFNRVYLRTLRSP